MIFRKQDSDWNKETRLRGSGARSGRCRDFIMMWSCSKSVRVHCLMRVRECIFIFIFHSPTKISRFTKFIKFFIHQNSALRDGSSCFDKPFFDLLLLPPLNRVVPARYDEELSCAMCGPVTVIKKRKKNKKKKRKGKDRTGKGGRLMSMEESTSNSSTFWHSKTRRNREASIVI